MLSCSKDSLVNVVPGIKYLGVSDDDITEFDDSLIVDLEYSDGDGDLGELNPDINSLYIKDRRLAEADFYFIKPLAPPDSKIQIKGQLRIRIKNTFLLGTGNSEKTVFSIKLRDRAGNWSNTVETHEITIHKKP